MEEVTRIPLKIQANLEQELCGLGQIISVIKVMKKSKQII
jgi:hypothetical protein